MLEPQFFGGEHFLFTLIAASVLMGAFLTVSLVMLWAPGKRHTWDEPAPESDVSEDHQEDH